MEFIYKGIKFNYNKELNKINLVGGSYLEDIYIEKEEDKYIVIELSEEYVYSDFGWEDEENLINKKYEKWEDIVIDFVDNYYKK